MTSSPVSLVQVIDNDYSTDILQLLELTAAQIICHTNQITTAVLQLSHRNLCHSVKQNQNSDILC